MAFIDDMRGPRPRGRCRCRVLREQGCQVAARTYRSWKQADRPIATRTLSDAVLIDALLATQGTPEGLYGRRKMTHWLRRQGHEVAFCTVDRLMRRPGPERGPPRQERPHHDPGQGRPPGRGPAGPRLHRTGTQPRWVTDFTYCRTWAGFVYVAFIVDVFAQRIVGWHAATDQAHRPGPDPAADRAVGTRPPRPPGRARAADPPLRRRQPVHLHPVHRAPRTRGASRPRSAPSATPTTTP